MDFNSHHLRHKTSLIYNNTARTVKDQSKATFSIQSLDTYSSFFFFVKDVNNEHVYKDKSNYCFLKENI